MSICTVLLLLAPNAMVTGRVLDQGRPLADAVVWLEGGERSMPGRATVDQRHEMFQPHIQIVTVGSKVDFPNNDDVFHNVYAESQAKRFDLGVYPRGKSKQVTFDKPGVVSVLCNVHSQMSAYIVVVDSPYFAKTDKQGRFKLPNVADHSYTVHVWHENGKSAIVKLSSGSLTKDLSISVTR